MQESVIYRPFGFKEQNITLPCERDVRLCAVLQLKNETKRLVLHT